MGAPLPVSQFAPWLARTSYLLALSSTKFILLQIKNPTIHRWASFPFRFLSSSVFACALLTPAKRLRAVSEFIASLVENQLPLLFSRASCIYSSWVRCIYALSGASASKGLGLVTG